MAGIEPKDMDKGLNQRVYLTCDSCKLRFSFGNISQKAKGERAVRGCIERRGRTGRKGAGGDKMVGYVNNLEVGGGKWKRTPAKGVEPQLIIVRALVLVGQFSEPEYVG